MGNTKMSRIVRSIALLALILAVAMGSITSGAALAKGGGNEVRRGVLLTSTAVGAGIGARGDTEVKVLGITQEFEVLMGAQVANGQTFRVFVTNSAQPGQAFLAGSIVIQNGLGLLALSNQHGVSLTAGTDPVLGIQRVRVRNAAGQLILQGSF